MSTDLCLDYAAFNMWLHADGQDNLFDLDRAKHMLPIVLNECVTATQREYIMKYFVEQLNISEISEIYGVNKSTVSRTIHRGLDNAYRYLRFVSPLFVNHPPTRKNLRNRKKIDVRGRKATKPNE